MQEKLNSTSSSISSVNRTGLKNTRRNCISISNSAWNIPLAHYFGFFRSPLAGTVPSLQSSWQGDVLRLRLVDFESLSRRKDYAFGRSTFEHTIVKSTLVLTELVFTKSQTDALRLFARHSDTVAMQQRHSRLSISNVAMHKSVWRMPICIDAKSCNV